MKNIRKGRHVTQKSIRWRSGAWRSRHSGEAFWLFIQGGTCKYNRCRGYCILSSFISLYQFFLILATAGLPVAISKMVSENVVIGDYRSASDILKLSIKLMLGIGFAGFVIFFFFAQNFSEFINMPKGRLQ